MSYSNSFNINPRLRILQVLPTFNLRYGGPISVGIGMSQSLCAHGGAVRMISADGEADLLNFSLEKYDVDNKGRWGYGFNLRLFHKIRYLVKNTDIVHIHGLWNFPASLAAKIARDIRIPYLISPHGMLTPWSMGQSTLKKRIYSSFAEKKNIRKASALHFFSEKEVLESEKWGSNALIVVIPNGVNALKYNRESDREELEKLFPELKRKTIVLYLGRLHPGKGLDLLLPAFASLSSEFSEIRLIVAGPDAEYSREMFRLIRELGITDKIVVTGFVTGKIKKALLGGSDIFVLPSRHEADSMSIKEALMAGLPVVITPHCHFPIVEEKGLGIVVKANIEEVKEGIQKFLVNPDLRKEMGSRGKKMIEDSYTWERIGLKFMNVYLELYDEWFVKRRTPLSAYWRCRSSD